MGRVEEAIEAVARGAFVVVVDEESRENEGDLVLAAERVTLEKTIFLLRHTSGVLCVALPPERADQLDLPLMVTHNTESQRTAFTLSVDAREGTTTGISAEDRRKTIAALADPRSRPEDFRRPGHVFPLRARQGGVLQRPGHTEAALELVQLAGLAPAALLCEIVNPDYSMARLPQLIHWAEAENIPLLTITELIDYRRRQGKELPPQRGGQLPPPRVRKVSEARLPTSWGEFTAYVYESLPEGFSHFVLVKGDLSPQEEVLVRLHSECLTGDLFGSARCDCGPQLRYALEAIAREGRGVLVYLRGHEGRGIGLGDKLRAYTLQDDGYDTVEANERLGLPVDAREYGVGAAILAALGVAKVRLLTNNPAKYEGVCDYGVTVVAREPLPSFATRENWRYLWTKQQKMGHHADLLREIPEEWRQ